MSNSSYKEFGLLLALAIVVFGGMGLSMTLFRLDNIFSVFELLLIMFVPVVVVLILAWVILKKKK